MAGHFSARRRSGKLVAAETVSEAARNLQEEGLIHYSRGHISVLDRAGLEARVCECYAAIKEEYDRLLGSGNRIGKPADIQARVSEANCPETG